MIEEIESIETGQEQMAVYIKNVLECYEQHDYENPCSHADECTFSAVCNGLHKIMGNREEYKNGDADVLHGESDDR